MRAENELNTGMSNRPGDCGRSRIADRDMTTRNTLSLEAIALERIAVAAREVQAASAVLEKRFGGAPRTQPSTLELARFAAAMQELLSAREEFDRVMANSPPQ